MAAISKEEYLKRYLSGSGSDDKTRKKKKKQQHKASAQGRVKIYDDDIGLDKLVPTNEDNRLLDVGEEAPQIAGVIDDRPDHIKAAERSAKWRGLGADQKENEDSPPQPTRKRYDSDSDNSPVRERKPQRKRHDSSDSDHAEKNSRRAASSQRTKRQSPPKHRQRHDSESDQSPPRKRDQASDSDQSPPRKRGQASDSDQSPPRKRGQASDSDQSPPRRRGQAPDSDQSPPRKRGRASDSDQSPPRRSNKRERSPSGNRTNSRDKKRSDGKREKKSRWSHWEDEEKTETVDSKGRDKKTLSGAVAGLSTAQQMREETKNIRAKEDEEFKRIDASVLGKDAETVVRKTGRRKKKEEEEETPEEIARKAAQKEQYDKWGKGLRQREDEQKNVEEALHEISKPLARGKDDEDLDRHLREQDRDGDPMLAYMKKKKDKPKAEKGKIVVMPKYKGPPAPPNRYNIPPGYRWDGRDRSNGFEKKFFTAIASRQAREQEAYMWSVEDM